jgi:hypothetical protein
MEIRTRLVVKIVLICNQAPYQLHQVYLQNMADDFMVLAIIDR